MKYLGEQLSTFNKQMEYAMANYQSHGKKIGQFKNIVISGLGGSGITGKIIKSYYLDKINTAYLKHIKTNSDLNVVYIDVSDLDFVESDEDYIKLLFRIKNTLTKSFYLFKILKCIYNFY